VDNAQFSIVVRDHHHALIALVTPLVGGSEAEEVVQNAWIKAYKAIAQFEGRSQIRTWLGSIAINEAKMQLRSRKRELLFVEMPDTDDGAHARVLLHRARAPLFKLVDHYQETGDC
jgi:RNA polymerase sigma-70 factor (ECF subfamily)